jgi:hypothetical protein
MMVVADAAYLPITTTGPYCVGEEMIIMMI